MTMFKTISLIAIGIASFISLSSSYGLNRFPSNRMLDFNWPEFDGKIRKFPHEKYCHYYYQHELDEIYTIRKCPVGEMFDYHVHECREKHTAQCWSRRYGKHAVHDHIHSKWRKHFKCPFPNGNYPDIFECEKYIVCLDGMPHHTHCPPNQQFDKNRRHCVYAAVCANSTDAALVAHMCPYQSGNFAYPQDCSKYYHCHKGKPNVKLCEENKLFDEEDRECKDKAVVDCQHRPDPYKKITAAVSTAKYLTAIDLHSSTSSANYSGMDTAAVTKAIKSSTQSESTVRFESSISPEIKDKISVTKDETTTELDLQSENLHSSISPINGVPVTKVDQSTTNKSYISTKASEPTDQSIKNDDISQSTISSSSPTAEPTVKSKPTKDFHSSKVSSNPTQSTATAA